MPKKSIIYTFYPRDITPETLRLIDESRRVAREETAEELRGKSFDHATFLATYKRKLMEKLSRLPMGPRLRVAIVEGVERDEREDRIASVAAQWDPRKEGFRADSIPYFEKVTDPEITIRPEIGITPAPSPWFTIGMYKTFGKTGSAALVGGALATITLLVGLAIGAKWYEVLLAALLVGGLAGAITYITMAGVEAGIPLKVM
jgi:hypothetical protein